MDIENFGQEILQSILGFLDIPATVETDKKGTRTRFNIRVEEAGFLIGKDGENLRALQYIFSLLISKKTGQFLRSETALVDVNNYFLEKENYLEALAKNTAQRVLETRKAEELIPMTPWERKIIHLALESMPGVASESSGEGEDRRVIIRPAGFPLSAITD